MPERIGFVSTRFAGLDGVSLESAKWAQVLWDHEHISFWYAGRLDRADDISMCIPEAHFGHPEIKWINDAIWGRTTRDRIVSQRIRDVSDYLKETIYEYVDFFEISILIIQNAATIPMNLPLGVAITEFLNETHMPAIAHHHDFYWERQRFMINSVHDYLDMSFPPRMPNLQHAVINLAAQEDLSWRRGIPSIYVPNVLDFENPPPAVDGYSSDVRSEIGLSENDVMILQPTRVVPRKGIEHAIQLVEMLGDPKYKLVVSHEIGDEGYEYHNILMELAHSSDVDLRFITTRVGEVRQLDSEGNKIYSLWDLYPHADLISYPSLYEGFGNAFLEAIYFKVPVLINRYAIFGRDIEPKGFRLPVMDGYLTRRIVEEVRRLLEDESYRNRIMDYNYEIATRFYSFSVLRRTLRTLVTNITGLEHL